MTRRSRDSRAHQIESHPSPSGDFRRCARRVRLMKSFGDSILLKTGRCHGFLSLPKDLSNDSDYPNKQAWIAARLLTLRHDLNETIKRGRKPNSLIIGSWNIRAFDDGVPRMDESFHYLAEIVDHFYICAIQEVNSDLAPLRRLKNLLGPNWDFFVSDVSTHKGGNNERMAFMYNTDRVFFRNLIGEMVLAKEDLSHRRHIGQTRED